MKNLFKRIFFGDVVIREYSTITVPAEIREKVYLLNENHTVDISKRQFLLCLEPVVFGIWLGKKEFVAESSNYKMHFKSSGRKNDKEKIVATITLDFFDKIVEDEKVLLLLKLKSTKIFYTTWLKTHLLYSRYYKKLTFSFNKLKSFAAAYGYPRKVRIISFKEENYFNIFPMDLLGDISETGNYVFGLRHTNVTLSKIIASKKIVVSEISYQYKDLIYELGKHHGSIPPTLDSLPFKTIQSEKFGFNVPEWVFSYKEIEILKTINLGSHMLMWGKVINEKKIQEPTGNLFHIHFLLYLYQIKVGETYPLV
jgi:hypothetical protein